VPLHCGLPRGRRGHRYLRARAPALNQADPPPEEVVCGVPARL
jgi:hypothetical protein